MPAKNLLRVTDKGTYSHIYNKGIENRLIFVDDKDYRTFLGYLKEYLSSPDTQTSFKKDFTVNGRTYKGTPHQPKNYFNKVQLIAFNLMPNHFHLVVHQLEQGSIESFLRSLSTRYSMYFNKRYQRQGSLFEGPYKSAHIAGTTSLVEFVAYLEQKHKGNKYSSNNKDIEVDLNSTLSRDVIEQIFTNAENSLSQGENDFNSYAEKHIFKAEDLEQLDKLILENQDVPLAGRDLSHLLPPTAKTPLKEGTIPQRNKPSRIPEYIGLSLGFVFLLGIGLWNVNVSSIQAMATPPMTTGEKIDTNALISNIQKAELPTDTNSSDEVLAATTSATEAITEATEPADILFTPVQILEGTRIVNIYNKPSLSAQIHRTAKEGEYFDGAPVDLDWYEVRLNGETTGFIQSEYVKLRQEPNL
jgi:REP element-mobilizing transposase RayT